jgi:hypothetical protein
LYLVTVSTTQPHGWPQYGLRNRFPSGTLLDRCEHLTERRGGMRLVDDD